MAVNTFTLDMTVTTRGEDTRYWDLSGLYCRTRISI